MANSNGADSIESRNRRVHQPTYRLADSSINQTLAGQEARRAWGLIVQLHVDVANDSYSETPPRCVLPRLQTVVVGRLSETSRGDMGTLDSVSV